MTSTDAVPSRPKVLDTYVGRHKKRTNYVLYSDAASHDTVKGVKVTAEDVTKRFLRELLERGGYKKVTLAKALGTSRGQFDKILDDGGLLMNHVTSLAESMKAGPHVVFRALAVLAEHMHDEVAPTPSVQRSVAEDDLPGRADRRQISAAQIGEARQDEEGDGLDAEPSLPPPPKLGRRSRNSSKTR